MTDEEIVRIGNYYLSGDYLIKNLEIIQREKQKTLLSLAHLEAAEKRILDKIATL